MTLKPIALAAAVLSLALASSCDKAADQQQKANDAQARANEKIAEVAGEAEQKIKNAQADADLKIAEAQAAFMKMREDYRHRTTTAMVDLDKQIADLDAKLARSKSITRTRQQLKINQLKAARDAFVSEYQALESASALTWDETRAKLDKQWAELRAMADAV